MVSRSAPFTKHCAAPRLFCWARGVGGMEVLSRWYSAVAPFAFTPGTPVRNTATRSARGVGGTGRPKRALSSTGSVGFVT